MRLSNPSRSLSSINSIRPIAISLRKTSSCWESWKMWRDPWRIHPGSQTQKIRKDRGILWVTLSHTTNKGCLKPRRRTLGSAIEWKTCHRHWTRKILSGNIPNHSKLRIDWWDTVLTIIARYFSNRSDTWTKMETKVSPLMKNREDCKRRNLKALIKSLLLSHHTANRPLITTAGIKSWRTRLTSAPAI